MPNIGDAIRREKGIPKSHTPLSNPNDKWVCYGCKTEFIRELKTVYIECDGLAFCCRSCFRKYIGYHSE